MGNDHHLVHAIVSQHIHSTCTYARMCIEPNRLDPRSKWRTRCWVEYFPIPIIRTKTKDALLFTVNEMERPNKNGHKFP